MTMLHIFVQRRIGMLLLVSLFLFLIGFGCSNTSPSSQEVKEKTIKQSAQQASIPLIQHEGKSYFDMEQTIFRLQFNAKWAPGKTRFSFGDHDVVYDVTPGEETALREEE